MIDNIIKDLLEEISKFKIDDVIYLSLLGSYREGEAVAGFSDCDFLFILKSDNYGNINFDTLKLLKEVSNNLSSKYPITFSFLTHTEFDLREYIDIEYLTHYSWGNVLVGNKSEYAGLFDEILSEKDTSDSARKSLIYYNIIHARFNVLRKFVSLNEYNFKQADKEITKIFVDKLIEIMDWILIYDGNYFKSKSEIIKQYKIKHPNSSPFLDKILEIRNKLGGNIEAAELKKFNGNSVQLLYQLSQIIINKYKND